MIVCGHTSSSLARPSLSGPPAGSAPVEMTAGMAYELHITHQGIKCTGKSQKVWYVSHLPRES